MSTLPAARLYRRYESTNRVPGRYPRLSCTVATHPNCTTKFVQKQKLTVHRTKNSNTATNCIFRTMIESFRYLVPYNSSSGRVGVSARNHDDGRKIFAAVPNTVPKPSLISYAQ
eukprot:2798057-Rhodomonas_salina.1